MSTPETKIMRLTTGEELICTVTSAESTSSRGTVYTLKDIAILIPTESNSLGLAPFVPYSEASTKGVEIGEKDVMFVTEPIDQLSQQYQSMFSKVFAPEQKIVT